MCGVRCSQEAVSVADPAGNDSDSSSERSSDSSGIRRTAMPYSVPAACGCVLAVWQRNIVNDSAQWLTDSSSSSRAEWGQHALHTFAHLGGRSATCLRPLLSPHVCICALWQRVPLGVERALWSHARLQLGRLYEAYGAFKRGRENTYNCARRMRVATQLLSGRGLKKSAKAPRVEKQRRLRG